MHRAYGAMITTHSKLSYKHYLGGAATIIPNIGGQSVLLHYSSNGTFTL
jgi:hypothetical protein